MNTDIFENEIQQALLGNGSLGQVIRVIQNGKVYALKRIEKMKINKLGRKEQLDREIQVMKKIHHQNVVQFISFEEKQKFYQIKMEYCAGQDLRKFLQSQKYKMQILPTKGKQFAVRVCLDILYACTELRSHLVVNRDIKLDNIVIDVSNQKDGLKIITKMIDFGQAKFSIQQIRTRTGTRGYMAPEVYFGSEYNEACDCWSLGLTFYEIFQGVNIQKLHQKGLNCPFKQNFRPKNENDYFHYYNKLIYEGISLTTSRTPAPFRYLIRQLLRVDPNLRIKFTKVLQTLVQRFEQYRDCFNSQEEATKQFQKLSLCFSLNKQIDKKKQQADIYLKKVRRLYKQLFLVFNKNIPEKQYRNNIQVIKLVMLVISKISQYMIFVQSIMQINTEYYIKQISNTIINEDQLNQMDSYYKSYNFFLLRNQIELSNTYDGITPQVQLFIQKNIGNTQKTINLLNQLLAD